MRNHFDFVSPIDRPSVRDQLEAAVSQSHVLETQRLISDACSEIDDRCSDLIELSDSGDKNRIGDVTRHMRIAARAVLRLLDEFDGVLE
jgi:hypothetical protein